MIKENIGGKYSRITNANGYFGRNQAGIQYELNRAEAGIVRSIGSGSKQFTFYNETHGTLTIWASSFEEAWRQAKERGYTRKNHMKR